MKFGFIVFALTTFTSSAHAYDCNTVMGGCPTNNGQVTSSHMVGSAVKAAPQVANPAVKATNGKNTVAQTGAAKKVGKAPLMQVMHKNVLK